jgi:uncharacterized membrane protein
MTAPAAASWAARLGHLDLGGTRLAFLGSAWAVGTFSVLALLELVVDQLPTTPSRKVPVQFGARLVSGGFAGAALGASYGALAQGLGAGVAGAVVGTLGGHAVRARLAAASGRTFPAALLEDGLAIAGAILVC